MVSSFLFRSRFQRRRRCYHATTESLEQRLVLSTFYVNGDAGNDLNIGSETDPFATLQRAVDAAATNVGDDAIELVAASSPYAGADIDDPSGALAISGVDGVVVASALDVYFRNDLSVSDITFTNSAVLSSTFGSIGSGDLSVSNIASTGFNGIRASTTGVVTVSGSTFGGPSFFEPNTHGVFVSDAASVTITGVETSGLLQFGIRTRRVGELSVVDSTIDNLAEGIFTEDGGDVSIVDTEVLTSPNLPSAKLRFFDFDSLTVDGVSSSQSLQAVASQTVPAPPVSITSSSFVGSLSTLPGVGISLAGDVSISDVDVSGSVGNGIGLRSVASAELSGITANDTGRVGIELQRIAGDVTVSDFDTTSNLGDGVFGNLISGTTTLVDGTSNGNGGEGLFIVDSGDLIIDGGGTTTFIGNRDNGIDARGMGTIDISGIEVSETGPFGPFGVNGIYTFSTGAVSIADSNISFNTFDGLGLYGTSEITLTNVVAENNDEVGFRSWASANVTINGGTFSSNKARGIQLENSTGVTISEATVANNGSTTFARYFGQSGAAGIAISTQESAEVSISGTAVFANATRLQGGGIYAETNGSVSIVNTTVEGNETLSSGGGILTVAPSTTLLNLTVANNTAGVSGGGIFAATSTEIGNSIVAGNTASNGPDLSGTVVSTGNNLIGDVSGATGFGATDLQNVDPQLQSLGDNGGPTFTMALADTSPALDAGNDVLAPMTDQRGIMRPQGRQSDIGAFETRVIVADALFGTSKLNLNSAVDSRGRFRNGTFTVSVLTTVDFDALSLDPSTVVWAGATALSSSMRDVDGDGDTDLQLTFRLSDTDLLERFRALANVNGSRNKQQYDVAVPLSGKTFDGVRVTAEDTVQLFMSGRKLRDLLDGLF